MNMPKSCEYCDFISTFTTECGLGCRCNIGNFEFWDYSKKQDNCPLAEVPTSHGRLIDVDALNQKIIETVNSGKPDKKFTARDVIQLIENAHIIIEAEE
jgi:hypothetical protein